MIKNRLKEQESSKTLDLFQSAEEYQPDKPTHKFYKENDIWMVRCLKTKGTFSTELWKLEKYSNQQCPCCEGIVQR